MAYTSTSFLDLTASAEHIGSGLSTVRRHVRSGDIPAVKIRGRVYVRVEDLDAFLVPEPIVVADASLKAWAERMAAKAPVFRPDQRDVIVSSFSSALRGA